MKKILTWMTVLGMLLSFAALAEEPTVIDPFADEAPAVEETTEDETTGEAPAMAVPDNYPDGQELVVYETGANPDVGTVTIGDVNFEVLQARDADQAEGGTMRITAKPGQQLFAVRLYFHPYAKDMTYDQAFAAKVQVGEDLYVCRKYIETREQGNLSDGQTVGKGIAMRNGYMGQGEFFAYLENVDGRTEKMGKKGDDEYYMFDVYTLVPEEELADNVPVFLILNVGEKQFWYQAM